MVRGLENFKEWFSGYESNYVVIGGTACDLLMTEAALSFRLTQDIDMVLIAESLSSDFGSRFWEYIKQAGYENCRRSTNTPIYFRFDKPKSQDCPAMIELFSRYIDDIELPPEAILTPILIDENISSLSAILLDDDYYRFLKAGITVVSNVPILPATHLIPFKARAWLDLTARRAAGEPVQSKDIKKHKADILRIADILPIGAQVVMPDKVKADLTDFISANINNSSEQLAKIAEYYGVANAV